MVAGDRMTETIETGWKFETADGDEGFEFAVKGGADAVKDIANIMDDVEQRMKEKQ